MSFTPPGGNGTMRRTGRSGKRDSAATATAKTPQSLVARLNGDVRTALSDAQLRRQLETRGLEAAPSTPEALARHIAVEIDRWGKVGREAGVRLE